MPLQFLQVIEESELDNNIGLIETGRIEWTVEFIVKPLVLDFINNQYTLGANENCCYTVITPTLNEAMGKAFMKHMDTEIGKSSIIVSVEHVNL